MIKKLLKKYKSIIMYLFFGVCTTLVNIISYYVFAHILKCSVMLSTIVAWVLAVLFAYITNRKWVFESKAKNKKEIFSEIVSFFSCRLATGVVDWLGMYFFVEKLGFNDVVIKAIVNIVVIILNYIFSKLIVFTDKKNKIDKKELLIYVSFLIVTFVFLFNSPLHIWRGVESGTDSSVFRTVGMMMHNGYLPYLDTFDHKGPLIYLYNYLGEWINHTHGIWYIEFISLYVAICYFFKIARLKCNRIISYIITILGLTLLFNFFEYGNLVEEYALPFITMSLFIFLDYLLNGNVNRKKLIVCGGSFGAVLLLRPNMISLWIVFCLAILIDCLQKKKYKELGNFVLYFIIGMVIIILPVFIWLGVNGIIKNFYDAYVLFNLDYTANYSFIATELPKYVSILENIVSYCNNFILIAALIVVIYLIKNDKKNWGYLIYFLLTIYLCCISGRSYNHYLMIVVPVIIYPFSCFFEYLNKNLKKDNFKVTSLIVSIFLIAQIIAPSWLDLVKKLPRAYHLRNADNTSAYVSNFVDIIKEKTNDDDKISVYGNWNIIYLASNRMHATKYSYQFPISKVREEILRDYYQELESELPKIIVVVHEHLDEKMDIFLKDHKYKLVFKSKENLKESDAIFELTSK